MIFACGRCHTRYKLPDEKVANRVLKVRCKSCGAVIVVRDPAQTGAAATAPPAEAAPTWFVALEGRQQGPITRQAVAALVRDGVVNRETFAWRPGMSEWLRAAQIDELAQLFHSPAGAPPPVPPPVQPPAVATKSPSEAQAGPAEPGPPVSESADSADAAATEAAAAEAAAAEAVAAEAAAAEAAAAEAAAAEAAVAEAAAAEAAAAEAAAAEAAAAEVAAAEAAAAEAAAAEAAAAEAAAAEAAEAAAAEAAAAEAAAAEAAAAEAAAAAAEATDTEATDTDSTDTDSTDTDSTDTEAVAADDAAAEAAVAGGEVAPDTDTVEPGPAEDTPVPPPPAAAAGAMQIGLAESAAAPTSEASPVDGEDDALSETIVEDSPSWIALLQAQEELKAGAAEAAPDSAAVEAAEVEAAEVDAAEVDATEVDATEAATSAEPAAVDSTPEATPTEDAPPSSDESSDAGPAVDPGAETQPPEALPDAAALTGGDAATQDEDDGLAELALFDQNPPADDVGHGLGGGGLFDFDPEKLPRAEEPPASAEDKEFFKRAMRAQPEIDNLTVINKPSKAELQTLRQEFSVVARLERSRNKRVIWMAVAAAISAGVITYGFIAYQSSREAQSARNKADYASASGPAIPGVDRATYETRLREREKALKRALTDAEKLAIAQEVKAEAAPAKRPVAPTRTPAKKRTVAKKPAAAMTAKKASDVAASFRDDKTANEERVASNLRKMTNAEFAALTGDGSGKKELKLPTSPPGKTEAKLSTNKDGKAKTETGRSTAVMKTISKKRRMLARCAREGGEEKVRVVFTIGASGKVTSASVKNTDDKRKASCITQVISRTKFPAGAESETFAVPFTI